MYKTLILVDVQDVAKAHILSMLNPKTNGERMYAVATNNAINFS